MSPPISVQIPEGKARSFGVRGLSMKPLILAGLAGVAIPAYGVYLRYRRDMSAARARLDTEDRHVISTRWGGSNTRSTAAALQCS